MRTNHFVPNLVSFIYIYFYNKKKKKEVKLKVEWASVRDSLTPLLLCLILFQF